MKEFTTIPSNPGVYLFKDKKGKILYVGKAKNLKNRIRSYFTSEGLEERKAKMISLMSDFSYIVTSNEFEALVLEANLIKQYKPPFNVLLRDDKSYPYLKITIAEDWPKIEVVRKIIKDGNLYFGPYVPSQSMWEALSFIRKNFSIRTCKYNLSKPIRPCIQYQMKKCPAPCARLISKEEYLKYVNEVILFLKGYKVELIEKLREKMISLSDQLKFEEAAKIRDQIKKIEKIFEKQSVISQELNNADVLGIYIENSNIAINVLFIRNGIVIGSKDYFIKNIIFDNLAELNYGIIESLYSKEDLLPPPLILLESLPDSVSHLTKWLSDKANINVEARQPLSEDEKAILEMAINNAKIHLRYQKSQTEDTLNDLKERFHLKEIPQRIGAFDVSNLFGTHSVGSFVYWENGSFNKKYYRHLKIKETEGIDDYAMMREIILRILKTFDKEDGIAMPNIVLVDGGKGHLNIALKVTKELSEGMKIFAIAKNPNRIILPDMEEISLEDKRPSSLLLRKIRDEAHRFAISYHKRLRKKSSFESPLEKIPGIGKKRRLILLKRFGSISKIKEASAKEIASLPSFNMELSERLLEHLKKC